MKTTADGSAPWAVNRPLPTRFMQFMMQALQSEYADVFHVHHVALLDVVSWDTPLRGLIFV